jgi:hypothetical protein
MQDYARDSRQGLDNERKAVGQLVARPAVDAYPLACFPVSGRLCGTRLRCSGLERIRLRANPGTKAFEQPITGLLICCAWESRRQEAEIRRCCTTCEGGELAPIELSSPAPRNQHLAQPGRAARQTPGQHDNETCPQCDLGSCARAITKPPGGKAERLSCPSQEKTPPISKYYDSPENPNNSKRCGSDPAKGAGAWGIAALEARSAQPVRRFPIQAGNLLGLCTFSRCADCSFQTPAGRSLGPPAEKAVPSLPVLWTNPRFPFNRAACSSSASSPVAHQLPDGPHCAHTMREPRDR